MNQLKKRSADTRNKNEAAGEPSPPSGSLNDLADPWRPSARPGTCTGIRSQTGS